MIEATFGMYGELQGIAGKTLGEIERLEMGEKEPALLALSLTFDVPYLRPRI